MLIIAWFTSTRRVLPCIMYHASFIDDLQNEDNFKNEDNLKTKDSLKMKKTSKLRRPQTLRLSIKLGWLKKWWQPKNKNDLKKEDNLKNQDEDSKDGCTYWAYTTTFVVLVSRVLQISICTLTFNLPFHHRTVMWYFGWNEGLCDIFTVFLSKPNPNSNVRGWSASNAHP